ncbi:hypothetical protein D3C78_1022710 [compost metagenome]
MIAAISAMLIAMALRPEFQSQFVASVVLLAVVLALYKLRKTTSSNSGAHLDQILSARRAN